MGNVVTSLTIAASAVVVLGGLIAVARSLLKFRDTVRDNTQATGQLTRRLDTIEPLTNGRLSRIESMLLQIWTRVFPGQAPPES